MRNLLSGTNVRLTAIRDEDLIHIENWFSRVEFLRFYDMMPAIPQTSKEVKEGIEYYMNSKEKYIFAIRPIDSDKIIGVTGFDDIIWSNGVATIFIGIGESEYSGKGLGKEAFKLILDFGFNELNFYRIQLNVIEYNKTAIKLYEGTGFIREGAYRRFIYRDGQRFDLYLYGLLKDEWN
jgi:RimJ/RimL family protein N-acetyltransferase